PPAPTPFPYTTLFRSIAPQDQRQRPRLDSVLDARLQLVQRRQDSREIARAGMLVIRLVKLRRAIAQIRDFVAHGLQTLDQPGGRSEEHTSELQSRENL